jgi:hypothetical protein
VGGGLLGQPLAGPHPPVQAGPGAAGQLEWLQALGVHQRQPGQGLGVDGVGLGMPRQKPPQISGLGRGHRYTVWPRRPKKTATGSHAGPVGSMTTTRQVPSAAPSSAAASSAARLATVERARRRAQMLPASSTTTAVWSLVMPRSIPSRRTGDGSCMATPSHRPSWHNHLGHLGGRADHCHRPRSPRLACARRAPLMCCSRARPTDRPTSPSRAPWQVPRRQSTARDDPASRTSQSRTCGASPDQPGVPCNPEPQQRSTRRGSLHEAMTFTDAGQQS